MQEVEGRKIRQRERLTEEKKKEEAGESRADKETDMDSNGVERNRANQVEGFHWTVELNLISSLGD